ncbi:flagellar protein export ATPase FliI [Burkholderia ubonensis]|uniref:flagellar protein export ATPase FliI n=1 Tax=Burkholderia ubonensis TaxID=101571 RepID=UPI0007568E55|nr:flagellar protein export ATPase FliI [Burkholderia ubonensis]KVO87700.1 flagellar protein export ATPase FliI [Burkholderia ubonensis]KVZ57317.1 flagellar protein export ATPase FliI [Burkholderia ubonensis]KVZ73014.1 flagellar protein export ATPase FliI [Burkholderia ubonensis]
MNDALRNLDFDHLPVATEVGRLAGVSGILLLATGCPFATGALARVETAEGEWIDAQVVGFRDDVSYLMPFRPATGLFAGARVMAAGRGRALSIGPAWRSRIVDGLGEPFDGGGPLVGDTVLDLRPARINPLKKRPVAGVLDVGVRAINGMLTLGRGQRVGLFAGSGVGKSVLLGMVTRQTAADVVVVGLIGERGREVREFVEHSLGPEGLRKAIVVVAPADESPLMRLKATELCHAIAAHFRDRGDNVLLLVDSLTRYAMAQRELALALGEPPATKGYPPSVFGMLPALVERAGNGEGDGSMSAIYTVLAEGDDEQDPIVDTARAILDGHIMLSRDLAAQGHYPAIDVTRSVSRCMSLVASGAQRDAARTLKDLLARHAQVRDLIPLGGYVAGADPETDRAVELHARIAAFLAQKQDEAAPYGATVDAMQALLA